jgi:hypothetical protein
MEGDEDERTHRRDGAGQVGRSYAGMEAVAGGRTPGCRRERDAVAAVREYGAGGGARVVTRTQLDGGRRRRRSMEDTDTRC